MDKGTMLVLTGAGLMTYAVAPTPDDIAYTSGIGLVKDAGIFLLGTAMTVIGLYMLLKKK